ncbi:MAG TPA: PIG-L family deacetylase [Steroidobacteraceae bacterium]|nr:PIG-L family deacetylase [Steroidobacteraceae bacterium]
MPLASNALPALAALMALVALTVPQQAAWAQPTLPLMRAPGPQDRVLVVAPHPDDESLCCAGILQRARSNGAATAVVWITAGDAFALDAMLVEHSLWPRQSDLRRLGAQRLAEAAAAATELGVPRLQQYFLGYPDRGVAPLMSDYYQRSYRSNSTGLSAVPYPQALSPYAAYVGSNLERDLEHVLDQFQPTLVLAAAPQDRHPDHNASGALARRLLERRGELDKLRYWIVHAPHWPQPRGYQPQLSLAPPAIAAALHWQRLPLSADERAHKLAALRDHRSQMKLTESSMLSFVRANELFALPAD